MCFLLLVDVFEYINIAFKHSLLKCVSLYFPLFRRKVSILEKERQDFQSTVDALQEGSIVIYFWCLSLVVSQLHNAIL